MRRTSVQDGIRVSEDLASVSDSFFVNRVVHIDDGVFTASFFGGFGAECNGIVVRSVKPRFELHGVAVNAPVEQSGFYPTGQSRDVVFFAGFEPERDEIVCRQQSIADEDTTIGIVDNDFDDVDGFGGLAVFRTTANYQECQDKRQ